MVGVLMMASASASDLNETMDLENDSPLDVEAIALGENENDYDLSSFDDEVLGVSDNSERVSVNHTPQTASEIQSCVDSANDGDTIILNGNYVFTSTITVNKSLTFRGINNAAVDGNSNVRLFTVSNEGVIFKNITFKNGYSDEGSAINGKCSAINCTFINNEVYGNGYFTYNPYGPSYTHNGWGGAVTNVDATGCIFINNRAQNKGGAMYYGNAINCTFSNNSALNQGGAMYYGNAINCTFSNNSAKGDNRSQIDARAPRGDGGAMYEGHAVNCLFVNNIAKNGGALYYQNYLETIKYCSFNNNSAIERGNEIFLNVSNSYGITMLLNVTNCNFTNCFSNNAWFIEFSNYKINVVSISYCNFINCFSNGNGGAISFLNVKYSVNNCYFEGNSAVNGGAIYFDSNLNSLDNCYFKNNHARYGGAIFYQVNKKNVINCCFEHNTAVIEGNEIFINDNNDVNMINCNFTNCISKNNSWFICFNQLNSISILNCNFINCSSNENGGAIFLININTCNIKNCYFEGNSAINGGAIYLKNISILNMTNCEFNSNFISTDKMVYGLMGDYSSSDGGAIYLNNILSSNIFNCTFYNNDAFNGGGVCLNESCCLINYCLFNQNTVSYYTGSGGVWTPLGYGGAIFIKGNANVIINNSQFENNDAEYDSGGAILGNCTVFNSNFTENRAMSGGAITYAKAINCMFIHNIAWRYSVGGAIMNGEAINCTFISNDASDIVGLGGAIYNGTAFNCRFINNNAKNGGAIYDVSAINCYFENNSAEYGGAVCNHENDLEVYNCSFINNSATNSGGAININGNLDCNVENCEFINCSSVNDGAAINCVKANEVNIIGCSFENCNSDNGGTYLNNNDETKMNILNCIFDEIPEGVSFNYNPILTVNNVSVVKGEKAVLIANLSDIRGQLANRNISFKVNENNYFNITNDEGIATFNIDEYVTDIGYYNVTVGFEGDEHVNPISTYSNVFINNYKGILSVSVDGKYYDDVTLIFKLIDSKTNNAVFNANIKVEFDDHESVNLRTDYNGIATYKVPFAPGNYMVTANVLDDNVDVNTVIDNFEINKIVGKVTVSQINNTILDIRLFNFNNGDVYRNINVTLKFDNMDPIYVITNEKGIATYKMDFEPGSYNVVAIVSKPYTEIQNVLETIEIADTSNSYSKVTFSSGIVFEYGSSGSIYVTVTGGSIDEENIKVLNHPEAKISLVKNVITISNLNPGSYKLFVGSIPSGDLKPGNGTVGITVKKATAVIKAQKITVALKKGTKWTITLVNAKTGKPISNMKLTLKVYTGKKYKTVHVTTNSNGVASYQTRGLSKGTHKVVVSAVDSRYNFNTLTSSIKVVKQKVLKFKVKKNIKNDGSSLSITAKYKNKGINGVKLNVLVYNGKKLVKKVSLKTKTKGKYKGVCGWGTNKLTVGSHKIVIVPANIKYGGSKKLNMKIKKSAKKYPNWETKI